MLSKQLPLLLETIKIEEGIIYNLPYHQKRCDVSRLKLYKCLDILDLASAINPPKKGLYRCRIVYDTQIMSIEYIPYIPKKIATLKIVPSNICYDLKYANRDSLNKLLYINPAYDEIILEKDGYLLDTSISNLAFLDVDTWITPKYPLLKGTMRQKLLDEGFLKEKMIKKEDIPSFKNVALINAMLGFQILNHVTID